MYLGEPIKGPLWKLPKDTPKPRKPIPKRGKKYYKYEQWKKAVAIPYLDAGGHRCDWCGRSENLDVDHIQGRGSHPELKMSLDNVRYLCRSCHSTRQ